MRKNNSYTDWGTERNARMREVDAKEPHIITHILLLMVGVPIVIFGFGGPSPAFALGGFCVMGSIIGFVEDYKKIVVYRK